MAIGTISITSRFLGEIRNFNFAGEMGRMNGAVSAMSLVLVIGIVLVLLLVVVLRKRKQTGKAGEKDYKAFLIIGLVFLPTGFIMMIVYFFTELPFEIGVPLFALGLIYLVIGVVNRDKWRKTGS